MSEITQEEADFLNAKTHNVRKLVRGIEGALLECGYAMQLERSELMEVLAALDLVYDGRARSLETQAEMDQACRSAMTLAGAVSSVSRVCIGEKDPGTAAEPEIMSPAGVLRI